MVRLKMDGLMWQTDTNPLYLFNWQNSLVQMIILQLRQAKLCVYPLVKLCCNQRQMCELHAIILHHRNTRIHRQNLEASEHDPCLGRIYYNGFDVSSTHGIIHDYTMPAKTPIEADELEQQIDVQFLMHYSPNILCIMGTICMCSMFDYFPIKNTLLSQHLRAPKKT